MQKLGENTIKVIEFLEKNPFANIDEIVKGTGLTRQYIQVKISKLKAKGKLVESFDEDGRREIKIVNDCRKEEHILYADILETQLYKLVEINSTEENSNDIRANIRLILEIIQTLKKI